MTQLPIKYQWLLQEKAPKMLVEALSHYGTLEHAGKGNNPDVMKWAVEMGVHGFYTKDEIPWCGLFVGVVAKRAGYEPPAGLKVLGAIHFKSFGQAVKKGQEMLCDILIFSRPGGNHVGFYVGEDKESFAVLGGNQSNSVTISWIAKSRLVAARRPVYKIAQPKNVRKIYMGSHGPLSTNEV